MKKQLKHIRIIALTLMLLTVAADISTATAATAEGIRLCLYTVIPGVFIFLFLGNMLMPDLVGYSIPSAEKMLRIPNGSVGFFLVGQVCGYPVGAKLLQSAAGTNTIPKQTAARMMCYCNNASPAFIIGILAGIFPGTAAGIFMWIIQICASFILGLMLRTNSAEAKMTVSNGVSYKEGMTDVLKTTAIICGWVIVFKVMIQYLEVNLLVGLNGVKKATVFGMLEITNGIACLGGVRSPSVRYILSGILLSIGGACVLLQTHSAAPDLPMTKYIITRLLHSGISGTLASFVSFFLFDGEAVCLQSCLLLLSATAIGYMILRFRQKNSSIQKHIVI